MTFVSMFDPKNEKHVLWLRDVDNAMKTASDGKRVDIIEVINRNPMKIKTSNMLDWAYTHFQICMKYTQSIFVGDAFIPKPTK